MAAASKKRGDEFLAFLPRTSHVYMYLIVFILSVLFQLYVSFRVGKEHSRPRSKITRPIDHLLIMCSNIISRLFGVSACYGAAITALPIFSDVQTRREKLEIANDANTRPLRLISVHSASVSCRRKQDQNTNKNKPADDDSGVESTGEEGIINKKRKRNDK